MRIKALLADEENAVSPVIGVILMVAITVILAAVIASFVLGLGPSDAAPTVNFDSEYNTGAEPSGVSGATGALNVSVEGGDTVPISQLSFTGDVAQVGTPANGDTGGTWPVDNASTTIDGSTAIQAGDEAVLYTNSDSYEVNLVWESDGSSQTLTTFEG